MEPGAISFLQGEALANSVISALATRAAEARIYQPNLNKADESKKAQFKIDLKRLLLELSTDYTRPVCDGLHVANISHLSEEMSVRHGDILLRGKFRIGVAQKALNLYLKYAWALNLIPVAPPHCPFDRAILGRLSVACCMTGGICNWTSMDSIACYESWVEEARKKLDECRPCTTLSDLEQCVWRRSRTSMESRS